MFGDKTFDQLIGKIDKVISNINLKDALKAETNIDSNTRHSESLKSVINILSTDKNEEKDNSYTGGNIENLLQSLKVPQDRVNRYTKYDEIYSSEPLVRRIVKTYINNILQKDAISSDILILKKGKKHNESDENIKRYTDYILKLKEVYSLDEKLRKKVIYNLLKYGDHFIEVIDLKNDIINLPDSKQKVIYNDVKQNVFNTLKYINENIKERAGKHNTSFVYDDYIRKISDCLIEIIGNESDIFDVHEHNVYNEYIEEESIGKKNESKINFNRILLRHHDPKNIIILESSYGTILGYIEIVEKDVGGFADRDRGIGATFAETIGQIGVLGGRPTSSNDEIIGKITNNIIQKIIDSSGIIKPNKDKENSHLEVNTKYENLLSKKIGEDLFLLIKRLFIENKKNSLTFKKLKVRFISAERMVAFSTNVDEFEPYGTSQINDLVFPANTFLLTKLMNTITKWSRASLMRKWTLEVGPNDQNNNEIQKLGRQLRNERTTINDIVSVKSVARTLSDFKDLVTLSKRGTKFLDVDVLQTGDPNIHIQDLQDAREELLAISGVPSVYIGYDKPVELREQLVNSNVVFAMEVIDKQVLINSAIDKLINIISGILLNYDKQGLITEYVTLSLKPPTVLLLQMLESIISSVGNLNQVFVTSEINFDPFYFLNKFVPNMDWDDFRSVGNEYMVKKNAETPPIDVGADSGSGGM